MPELYLHPLRQGNIADEATAHGIPVTRFPFLLGRSDACDHMLPDPLVSRKHCLLFLEGEEVRVRDLGSRNGTFLNGWPVTSVRSVREGDTLQIGLLAFRLRLGVPALASPATPGATATASGRRRQVLVVEDNADTAETLAMLLHDWGHDVRIAHDGRQALQAAQEHPPDAVLLDICLPGMNGYEVAEQLRGQEGFGKARLVALTGYESEIDRRRSREAGFDMLLTKPVDPETLGKALNPPG
jgi:CheY-like chemotaxis protein